MCLSSKSFTFSYAIFYNENSYPKFQFSLLRSIVWIGATTGLVMCVPYMIEKERAEMEKTQVNFFIFFVFFHAIYLHPF